MNRDSSIFNHYLIESFTLLTEDPWRLPPETERSIMTDNRDNAEEVEAGLIALDDAHEAKAGEEALLTEHQIPLPPPLEPASPMLADPAAQPPHPDEAMAASLVAPAHGEITITDQVSFE